MVKLVGSNSLGLSKVIDGKAQYIHIKYSAYEDGMIMTDTAAEDTKFIGVLVTFNSQPSPMPGDYSWARFVVPGDKGADGIAGKDGVGLKSTTITYGLSATETTQPTTYTSEVPPLTKGQYLWTKTIWAYTDETNETGYTKTYIAKDGNDGSNGIAGKDGVGLKSTVITYGQSANGSSSDGITWTSTIPVATPGDFLWTKTVWAYTDDTSETGYSVTRSGTDGTSGKDGIAGKDGKGILSTTITYGLSTTDTVEPTNYTSNVPTLVKGRYLWTKTVWEYTDTTIETGYTKTYIAKDGNDGTNGLAGKDGVGISKTTITYAKSINGTTAPTSGWTATVPSTNPGDYLWTKTVWTYTDNTNETGYSVGKIGNTGASGKDGVAGKDGVGISSTVITYATSTSGTTAPTTADWSSSVPTLVKGQYLWTRTVWFYTDATNETGYSVSYISKDGNDGSNGIAGKDGVGIKLTTVSYAKDVSGTIAPASGWTTSIPTVSPGQYLWTRTIWTYTDDTTETGYSTARMGVNGSDGISITQVSEYYQVNNSPTVAPADTPVWSTTPMSTSTTNRYLWNYEVYTYSDGSTQKTSKKVISVQGVDGNNGNNGISITKVENFYLVSTLNTGITTSTSGWVATPPLTTTTNKYLWNYEKITYSSGNPTLTKPCVIGVHGSTGDPGKDGIAGKDGKGVKSTTITYTSSSSGTTAPTTGWTSGVPTVDPGNFLWTRTIWVYTDDSSEIGYTVSYIATNGNDGSNGIAGKDGVGIKTTTITYASSTNGTAAPATGWTETIPTVSEGSYLWTKTIWTYTDNTTETGYSVARMGVNGTKGATGAPGVSSYTWIRYSPNASGSSMTQKPEANSLYIGVAITSESSAPEAYTSYTWALIKGANGKGVKSAVATYQASTSGTTIPTGSWLTTVPTVPKGQYLWTRVITTYTDNTTTPSYSASYQGVDGITNVTGLLTNESITLPANVGGTVTTYTGATGTFDVFEGVTKKTGTGVTYTVLSKTNIEVAIATTGVYTITSMTSGLTTLNGFAILRAIYNGVTIDKQINVAKAVTGATGATGSSGKDGVAGKDGKGINSTVIAYMTSTSGTTAPTTGWTATVPSLTKGQYLWTRTIWTYTDSTTETGYSVSYIAKDGNNGTDGIAGKDGVGIKSTSITYTGSTSGTVTPTSGWATTVPTVASGSFLWTRTIWTYTDNTTETGYSVARMGSNGANGATGATGAPGVSATSYWITASNNIIGKSQTGVINPTTITFKGFSKTGTANSVAYSGRFIIQTSTDGTTYTTRYTSSANQNSYTYTIPADSLFVKCLFYMAGGTTVLLDEQTVPIVESAEGLNLGNRNLFQSSMLSKGGSTKENIVSSWAIEYVSNENLMKMLDSGKEYTFSFDTELMVKGTSPTDFSTNTGFLLYSPVAGKETISFYVEQPYLTNVGDKRQVNKTFICPQLDDSYAILFYTGRQTTNGGAPFSFNTVKFSNLMMNEGNKKLGYVPALEDARTYKAWANSSEGSVDFTRVYPNENMALGTHTDWVDYDFTAWTFSTHIPYYQVPLSELGLQVGDDIVISVEFNNSVGSVPVKVETTCFNSSKASVGAPVSGNFIAPGSQGVSILKHKIPVGTEYITIPSVVGQSNGTRKFGSVRRFKLERGTTPTVYTTNTADSLTGSVPKYVGFSPLDSDKPSDYEWIINPEWTESSSKEYTSSRIEQTSESIMTTVTESFVRGDEFTDYKKNISTQFEQTSTDFTFNFSEMEKIISSIDGKVDTNQQAINEYIRFSDGRIILGSSGSDSSLEISRDKISFIQGGAEVAFFGGQSFYINKGVLVESMQVGDHRMTKGSNGHTTFVYVG